MPTILALKVDKTKPIRTGQDYIWQVIRDLTEADRTRPVYLDEVHLQTDCGRGIVRINMRRFQQAGLLEVHGSISGECWTVLKRPTRLPPMGKSGVVAQSAQAAMWTAMRALGELGARELALAAATEERPVSVSTASSYLRRLHAAGYLVIVQDATSARPASYRLRRSMNTGPDAPRILKTRLVYDPNRNEVMGLAEAEEAT